MISSVHSFKLLSKAEKVKTYTETKTETTVPKKDVESDSKKRSFIKLAGVVGAGALATSLIPKRAEALVFGSAPTATAMGVKNASGTKINPATEDTLAGIKGQTDLLTFDSTTNPANLKVNIAAGAVGLTNIGGTQINPATQDTLAAIKAKTDQFVFSGNSLQTTVGGTGNIVGIKDTTSKQINPATDDSLVYLRRMVKLMESQATVDANNRQRVVVDGFGAVISGITGTYSGASGVGVPRVTLSTDSSAAISAIAGWGDQMFADPARTAYATGIRTYLGYTTS